jgi:hypothetical protein
VQDGRVVATQHNSKKAVDVVLDRELEIDRSAWIAARAYSSEILPYQEFALVGFDGIPVMAHTSPIYVSVDGRPRRSSEDARILLGWVREAIDWARTVGRFQDSRERDAMIELFQRAEQVYLAQLDEETR